MSRLLCEGLTIRQLRGQHTDKESRIDETVTNYLNNKPGTWRLVNATTQEFGWYFIWLIPDQETQDGKDV